MPQPRALNRLKGRALYSEIPTYHERLSQLTEQLREVGHLGLVLIDASELARVEHDYGSRAFEQVLSIVSDLVRELQGSEVRASDLLALDERGGNAFLLFLSPRRGDEEGRPRIADLEAIRHRVDDQVNRKLSSFTSPYLRGRPRITVGYSVVFHNPLIMAERVIARLVVEAWQSVHIQKTQADFQTRCRLQDVLLGHQITTVFQPIVDLKTRVIHGFEALSRGPAGTQQHSPINLFEAATATELVFELDRHCRRRAMRTARDLPAPHLLFVNVVPASMYDSDFQGTSLIHLLEGLGLSPARIVLEVSELYAIENYTLFAEALQNFTQLGFSIAVDDIGAKYSGLEKIAHLQPRYLKFDMQLVRDIDKNPIKREMARALKTFADKMDSQIIAEGIEREGEQQACVELGLHYGQGYLLARPAPLETFNLGVAAPSSAGV
jgi:EAL domain-containing protein (putative c-di-GMP-specific phosphodiesterase class I)/GGDEF domain-containing protein